LLALDHVSSEIERVPEFADPIQVSFNLPPSEAIEYFRSKRIVRRKQFDRLAEDARAAAFTVAGLYKEDLIAGFKEEIAQSLEKGAAQDKVIKRFRAILDGAGHRQLGAFHLETVFRTNMQMAYGVGRRRALEAAAEDFPFWQYNSVGDDRVRETHQALNGLILPAGHEFWRDHFPPWQFNCRCSVTAVDREPDGYDRLNPSGEAEIFYDDRGNPAKAEIGTAVYDLTAEGNFQGVPPQGGLRDVIEGAVSRARKNKTRD
jgi:SPP1 gp7 family putative phage head morphogenesis protein